jgi:hypothetical protein
MSLNNLGLKYNTDKATYHGYLDFYKKHIDRSKVNRFLEIGILTGSSIRTWREWFKPDTVVEGWDINPVDPIKNCELRLVDQTNRNEMLTNITGLYDVILDDGGHTTEMIETSFATLFKHSKMYIIEDLHAPWVSWDNYVCKGDVPTIDLLDKLEKDGWLSKYATDEEKKYIDKNAKIVEVYWQGDRLSPKSMSIIIANKDYI